MPRSKSTTTRPEGAESTGPRIAKVPGYIPASKVATGCKYPPIKLLVLKADALRRSLRGMRVHAGHDYHEWRGCSYNGIYRGEGREREREGEKGRERRGRERGREREREREWKRMSG